MMDKETIKKFLKPSKWKIFLFSAFVLLNGLMSMHAFGFLFLTIQQPGDTTTMYGIPFVFYEIWGCPILPPEEVALMDCPTTELNIFNLILDVVLWYLVSCLMIFAYHKFRKKQ